MAEPARAISPSGARVERAALWHKAGTIERVMRDRGAAGGERLHPQEKLIAVHLLGYASTSDRNPRCFRDEKDLVDELGLDRKTYAKYVGRLAERGLIEARRDRDRGGMTYYLAELVRRFAEDGPGIAPPTTGVADLDATRTKKQSGKDSRSEVAPPPLSDRETAQPDRETLPARPGNAPGPDRESLPVSIELVSGTQGVISDELQSLARRFGMDPAQFEGRPHRIAGAIAVANHCTAWGITYRRLRALTRQHGFKLVAGAVGYVLCAIDLSERRASEGRRSERSAPPERDIRNPAALFETALTRGWTDQLPGLGDDPYLPDRGRGNVDDALWTALSSEISARVSRATFDACWRSAKLVSRDGSYFRVACSSTFAESIARKSIVSTAVSCLQRMGFSDATVDITSA